MIEPRSFEPPVRLCCGQRHFGVECPDGMTMCCLCFDRYGFDDLYTDEAGETWDVCKKCQEMEERMKHGDQDS